MRGLGQVPMSNFILVKTEGINDFWKTEVSDQERREASLEWGCEQSRVKSRPILLLPQCALAIRYIEWFAAQPISEKASSVSPCMLHPSSFCERAGGVQPIATFLWSMERRGCPHHISRAVYMEPVEPPRAQQGQ